MRGCNIATGTGTRLAVVRDAGEPVPPVAHPATKTTMTATATHRGCTASVLAIAQVPDCEMVRDRSAPSCRISSITVTLRKIITGINLVAARVLTEQKPAPDVAMRAAVSASAVMCHWVATDAISGPRHLD